MLLSLVPLKELYPDETKKPLPEESGSTSKED